jgi:hypothetical protein
MTGSHTFRRISRAFLLLFLTLPLGLMFVGCPGKNATKETGGTPVLELSLTVASLDLSNLNRRLTKADVSDLWNTLKSEKVEVLAVQNLTRYPGLATRTDFINELRALSDWRSAFGELVDNSGRQTGNAVFASYPIRSHSTVSFHKVKGALFEGALHTVIDGGVREIIVASVVYPPKAGEKVRVECRSIVAEARGNHSAPMILSGDNPAPGEGWEDVFRAGSPAGIQYDGAGAMRATSSRRVNVKLGSLSVVTFGLYRIQS